MYDVTWTPPQRQERTRSRPGLESILRGEPDDAAGLTASRSREVMVDSARAMLRRPAQLRRTAITNLMLGETAASNSRPRRAGKRAKALTDEEFQQVLDYIRDHSNVPESDYCVMFLSFYAGLRAAEIASLRMEHVTTAGGEIAKYIHVMPANGKGGKGRVLPMHKNIAQALKAFQRRYPDSEHIAISDRYGGKPKSRRANTLSVYLWRLYDAAGLKGCSSHSGRRTCITKLAREANLVGASLRDVQLAAGHARLDTTGRYIEPTDNLCALMDSVSYSYTAKGARR